MAPHQEAQRQSVAALGPGHENLVRDIVVNRHRDFEGFELTPHHGPAPQLQTRPDGRRLGVCAQRPAPCVVAPPFCPAVAWALDSMTARLSSSVWTVERSAETSSCVAKPSSPAANRVARSSSALIDPPTPTALIAALMTRWSP